MDARQFLAEFGHIANASGGMARLRSMIYQLAVTGRLVAQDPAEGQANELLATASNIREQLIREHKFKRAAKLESEPLVVPKIIIPPTWQWSRLLDLGEINPRNQGEEDAFATFIPMAGVSETHGGTLIGETTRWGKVAKGYTHFANGDVILAKITPCYENGKAAVIDALPYAIGAGSTEFHVFRSIHPGVLPGYVYLFLRSPLFRIDGEANMSGTAGQKRLPTDYFALRAFPLPPLSEQSRIVAKVDELMALCDKLEQQQQERRKLQNALRHSTLQAVSDAASRFKLQTSWERLSKHIGQLFRDQEDVRQLRDVVFDLGRVINSDRVGLSGLPHPLTNDHGAP